MTDDLKFQLRLTLGEDFAQVGTERSGRSVDFSADRYIEQA